jgi:hypothetical protein
MIGQIIPYLLIVFCLLVLVAGVSGQFGGYLNEKNIGWS